MREYETIYLLKPDIPVEQISDIKDKVASTVEKGQGHILAHSEWGKRKLAYDIKKFRYANYVFLQYLSDGGQVSELERILKYDDNVLKFLTVKIAEVVDSESRLSTAVEPPPPPEELQASTAGDFGGSRSYGDSRVSHERKASSYTRNDSDKDADSAGEEE